MHNKEYRELVKIKENTKFSQKTLLTPPTAYGEMFYPTSIFRSSFPAVAPPHDIKQDKASNGIAQT